MTSSRFHVRAAVSPSTAITRSTPIADLPALLKVEEVASFLGIGRGLAYALAREGKLPSVRFGRLLRIPREALTSFNHDEVVK